MALIMASALCRVKPNGLGRGGVALFWWRRFGATATTTTTTTTTAASKKTSFNLPPSHLSWEAADEILLEQFTQQEEQAEEEKIQKKIDHNLKQREKKEKLEQVKEMQASIPKTSIDWKYKPPHPELRSSWDNYQYCIAAKRALASSNLRDAVGLVEEGRRFGHDVNAGYHGILTFLVKERRCNNAITVFNRLKKYGSRFINPKNYCAIIRAVVLSDKEDKVQLADKYYTDMLYDGVLPNELTYKTLFKLCSNEGLPKKALEYLQHMEKIEVVPTPYIYDLVLRAFFKARDSKGAVAFGAEMLKKKTEDFFTHMSVQTLSQLVECMKKEKQFVQQPGPLLNYYKHMDQLLRQAMKEQRQNRDEDEDE